MASLLSCFAVTKSFGARVLFRDLSLTLSDGDRTGLIGPNGSGKTTLLEVLAGNQPPDTGERAIRKQAVAVYVPQDSVFAPGDTVGSVLREALAPVALEEAEKDRRFEMMLGRAGFTDAETPAAALSGGWRKRLAIAAALVKSPDVLLLDEPTNHLDLDGIEWLERAIGTVNACLVVTHDRYFLENVATRMLELNRAYPLGTFEISGNYSQFLEARAEFLEAQAKQRGSLSTKVRREVEWLRRGPKARTGKSRARVESAGKLIDELAEAQARAAVSTARIDFTSSDRKTRRLIEAENVSKSLGDRTLFRDLNLVLSPGVRVGLVGANGSGKTSLLRVLEGALEPDSGEVRRADALRVVSFAQDRTEHLDLTQSLRRSLCPEGDSVIYRGRPIHVAGWAKRFLFREEQFEMPVASLSGGERARVLIARLMLHTADVLLLDEPTNDLDIPTLEVLEESLLEFQGAMVLVSHDRYLLDRVSTVVVGLEGGEAGVFASYSQWEAARAERPAAKPQAKAERQPQAQPETGKKKLSYLEQREWDAMEQKILEAEQEFGHWELSVQQFASDPTRLMEACREADAARVRVDTLYARWAELEKK